MKKLLVILLSLFLAFSFCKKSGSDADDEGDNITVEVTVKENGQPVANLFVIITAKVQETVKNRAEGDEVISYETTAENQQTTTTYGKATFNYVDKSLPERGGIVIEKVTIKRLNDIVHEDTEEKFIKKNGSLNLEYEI